ncbi:hypothetical protein [Kitasatospora cheerisanensis]|nr:hypothetical protein [Kitasatospora cheerisanensis]
MDSDSEGFGAAGSCHSGGRFGGVAEVRPVPESITPSTGSPPPPR